MRDELRLHALLLNVPDRAGGVNGRGSYHAGVVDVPVERGQRRGILFLFAIGQLGL